MEAKLTKKMLLIGISIFLSFIFIDETGVAVTLPDMQVALHLSNNAVQWVMNGMFLPLAVLVLLCGKLSDILGYKKIFSMGLVVFFLASIICMFAVNGMQIIAGRILQGVGGSMMLSTYAVFISLVFPENERGMALGTCASFASIFLATGPFIGGFFSHYLSWRVIFAINLPLIILSGYFVLKSVGSDELTDHPKQVDGIGAALFIVGFGLLIYTLMQAVVYGWYSSVTILLLSSAVLLLLIFVFVERRHANPLVHFELFKVRNFLAGNVVLLCTQVVVMSLTYWAIWLQNSLSFSPLLAGVALFPAGLPILFMAKLGGIWLDEKGPRFPIGVGSVIMLVGMIWLAVTAPFENYWLAFWGFLGYGIGAPLIISPAIGLVMSSVPAQKRGMASGILNTMRQLGATMCFAIIGVVITNYNHARLAVVAVQQGRKIQDIEHLLSEQNIPDYLQSLQHVARTVYTHAFTYGMWVAVLFSLVTVVFAMMISKKSLE